MASLEQKTALVDKYCNAHREWVQNAEMHQRNYDSAMSDYASANQRANSAQYELERLYDQMSSAENEMRSVELDLNSLNDGQEHSASEYQYLRSRLEAARDSYRSAQSQVGPVQGELQQAQGEARQAYLVAQQESQQYEQAQANVEKCSQALEQMSAQLSQEADVLQMQVDSESSYASTLQGASGNMFANSALAAAGRLQASASTKQAELTGTQALIDRIHQELNGGDSTSSMGASKRAYRGGFGNSSAEKETNSEQNLSTERQAAVRRAWEREVELVKMGKGTRNWTVAQQKELLETGKISGFEGQHMRNVANYPEVAGNSDNIQFLHYLEHLYGAHQGNFRNETEGYYDTNTGEMRKIDDDFRAPMVNLSDIYDPTQTQFTSALGREFGYNRKEDYDESRIRHKDEKSGYNFWEGKSDFNDENLDEQVLRRR